MRKSLLLIIVLLLCVSCSPSGVSVASADNVDVVWNASVPNDTPVVGYRIYYGTASGDYPNNIDSGLVTTDEVTGLTQGQTYYFVVRAYNEHGESASSNELSVLIPEGEGVVSTLSRLFARFIPRP